MNIDTQKYDFDFLSSPLVNYQKELELVRGEKRIQQSLQNEEDANELWRVEHRILVFYEYLELFLLLKKGDFYQAWCKVETIELAIENLTTNYPEDSIITQFILHRIRKLQQLYPYRFFISTEVIVKEYECSICGTKLTPRKHCNHQIRKVYNGEMCHHIVKKASLLGISIVSNPEHKYTVLFAKSNDGSQTDQYDYSIVKALLTIWKAPFQYWDYSTRVSYHPKGKKEINPDSLCPCISGKLYKDCCQDKPGIRHVHITFLRL